MFVMKFVVLGRLPICKFHGHPQRVGDLLRHALVRSHKCCRPGLSAGSSSSAPPRRGPVRRSAGAQRSSASPRQQTIQPKRPCCGDPFPSPFGIEMQVMRTGLCVRNQRMLGPSLRSVAGAGDSPSQWWGRRDEMVSCEAVVHEHGHPMCVNIVRVCPVVYCVVITCDRVLKQCARPQ